MFCFTAHGLPISIDCASEGHLVDAFLPESAETESELIDIESVLSAEESEIQFDDIVFDDVCVIEPGIELDEADFEQYLS